MVSVWSISLRKPRCRGRQRGIFAYGSRLLGDFGLCRGFSGCSTGGIVRFVHFLAIPMRGHILGLKEAIMRWVLVGLVGLGLGCTDARDELADLGIAYTVEAFLRAAVNGNLTVVKLFVASGMSVNTANSEGETLLMWAAYQGHLAVVRYLVENGAAVNAKNDYGDTALHWAASRGHLAVVRYLVEHGADVKATADNGVTALHYAASRGHLEVVRYLVEHGADVNAKNNDGGTALQGAAVMGHLAVVRYLESVGRD